MSWKPEVRVPADNKWYDNAIRFDTKAEALAYAIDLRDRWTAVRDIRTTEVDDKVNASWINGKTVWHDMADGSLQTQTEQRLVAELMLAWEPVMEGYPRGVILLASMRLLAAMLGPAKHKTRDDFIAEIPQTIHAYLKEMDRLMEKAIADVDPTMRAAKQAYERKP